MNDRGTAPIAWLMIAAAMVLAAGIGLRAPWPADEPRFALIARDMVEQGNWLIPRVGGALYPDKPPLFFWLVAAFYSVTRSIRIAFLAPALFAGLGVLWLVIDLARRLWNPQTAFWTGATLLAIVQFPLQMKSGQIDGVLCFWTTLGLYGLCRHLLLGPDWRWYTISGLAAGLGVITKGVGFLPFLILIPYLVGLLTDWPVRRVQRGHIRWLLAPLALVVAIGIWLVPMLIATSGAVDPDLVQYRDNILLKQTVTRYSDAWMHQKPPWYFLTDAIPWLWLPVSFLLPWLIPAWRRDWKMRRPAVLLLGGWLLLVLLFFTLSAGKRSVYIFPAAPALALLAGLHMPAIVKKNGPRIVLLALSSTVAATLAGIGAYSLMQPSRLQDWLTTPGLAQSFSWRVLAIGIAGLLVIAATRLRKAPAGFAAVLMCGWIGASLLVFPLIDDFRSGRVIIDAADEKLRPGDTLAFAGWKEQLLFQWNRPATHFGYRRADPDGEARDAAVWLSQGQNRRVLLPEKLLDPCFDRQRVEDLGAAHRERWFLAAGSSVSDDCDLSDDATDRVVLYRKP